MLPHLLAPPTPPPSSILPMARGRNDDAVTMLIIFFFFLLLWSLFGPYVRAASGLPPTTGPCAEEAALDLCNLDERGCKRIYESRGLPGVSAAMRYHHYIEENGHELPYIRFVYRNADVFHLCSPEDPMKFVAGAEGNENVTKAAVLNALVYYGGVLTRAVLVCSDPSKIDQYDPETGQSRCVCMPGHVCVDSDDSSISSLSGGYILSFAAGAVLILIVVAMMSGSIYTHHTTVSALTKSAEALAAKE